MSEFDAQSGMRRIEDQGYRLTIETTDHIGSTTFAGHNHHEAEVTIGLDDSPELVRALDAILDVCRSEHRVGQFGCDNCDTPFRLSNTPDQCPYCGSEDVTEYDEWVQQ